MRIFLRINHQLLDYGIFWNHCYYWKEKKNLSIGRFTMSGHGENTVGGVGYAMIGVKEPLPHFFKMWLYTKPYWKIIQFLFRKKTPKNVNVTRGNLSNNIIKMIVLPIALFKTSNYRDRVWYVNCFLLYIIFFHLKQQSAKKFVHTFEEIMFELKYDVANDTKR